MAALTNQFNSIEATRYNLKAIIFSFFDWFKSCQFFNIRKWEVRHIQLTTHIILKTIHEIVNYLILSDGNTMSNMVT